ncbi:hypothetical protein KKH23_07495 [Patescibacteria group bacterium]|nr:hypothetical protein [Patescibacteria group bacterium]
MRTAKIKRGLTAPIEVDIYFDGHFVASIRCQDYEVDDNMIICIHEGYNSYIYADDHTVTTWRHNYAN